MLTVLLLMMLDAFLFYQTHAEVTLAKADAALRQKETEIIRLRADHQALWVELTAVKQGLSTSTERAEKLHEEGQVRLKLSTEYQIQFLHLWELIRMNYIRPAY